jgi:hypothetical protein
MSLWTIQPWLQIMPREERAAKYKVNHSFVSIVANQAFMASQSVHLGVASDWIMDSGTTTHVSSNRVDFHTFKTIPPKKVFMGNDTVL